MTGAINHKAKIARRLADVCEDIEKLQQELNGRTRERVELQRMLLSDEDNAISRGEFPQKGTMQDDLLQLFRAEPNRAWRMKDLMACAREPWSESKRRRVFRSRIYTLIGRGLIDKINRGVYRLKKDPLAGPWVPDEETANFRAANE